MITLTSVLSVADGIATPTNLAGAAGVAIGSSWALLSERRAMLIVQGSGAAAFALHYVLLGATTGAVMCVVALLQTLASLRSQERRFLGPVYGASACVVAAATMLTWHGPSSLLAASGSALAMTGRLQTNAQRMRWAFLGCTLAWLGHNAAVRSPFGLAADGIGLVTLCVGLWRGSQRFPLRSWSMTPPTPLSRGRSVPARES